MTRVAWSGGFNVLVYNQRVHWRCTYLPLIFLPHRKEPLFFFDKTRQQEQSLDLTPPPRMADPARGAGVAHLPQLREQAPHIRGQLLCQEPELQTPLVRRLPARWYAYNTTRWPAVALLHYLTVLLVVSSTRFPPHASDDLRLLSSAGQGRHATAAMPALQRHQRQQVRTTTTTASYTLHHSPTHERRSPQDVRVRRLRRFQVPQRPLRARPRYNLHTTTNTRTSSG